MSGDVDEGDNGDEGREEDEGMGGRGSDLDEVNSPLGLESGERAREARS